MAAPSSGVAYSGLPRMPNFKVHRELGRGSYGKVYKVERESDKQVYALKVADFGSMSQAERADAVNEVRLLVSIAHHNVIRYHEAFVWGNKLCTVMEYAPFGDLKYYIDKGRKTKHQFPEEAIWRILLQLCKGLQALHAQNVIHRDIKPANIFLCANDLLKIGDLGIAKALTRVEFTRTQIGTPSYMAPEVWSGRPYSYGSDMWSVGAVLYEMMTFRTPMEGRNMLDLRNRIIGGRFAPIKAGTYSQELINICHNLLSTEPSKRPSPSAILASHAASRWLHVMPEPPSAHRRPARRWTSDGAPSRHNLLDTIVVPRDIRQLPKHLPPPSYDTDAVRPAVSAPPTTSGAAAPSAPAASSAAAPSSSSASSVPSAAPHHRACSWSGAAPSSAPSAAPAAVHSKPAHSHVHAHAPAGSKPPSREHSRAPSPADLRGAHDNRKGYAPAAPLPPVFPRVPSSGLHAVAAAAAALAYQHQRWTPSGPPVQFNAPRVLPQRRVSYS
ncbi:hypothetical protein Agub_g11775 [Astrephomene gubernaculifera]|uniref:non-specific serine/threonine protein kinase n=1 Tax=Astrephomene gubernaculifera TaxID=47775 RepID=A0AAD3HRD3_9CHLO|nr:hypothetical protein Agub_g11775 [Astrephomene gubernaculifera]